MVARHPFIIILIRRRHGKPHGRGIVLCKAFRDLEGWFGVQIDKAALQDGDEKERVSAELAPNYVAEQQKLLK